jgi:hypothetical protein
MRLLWLPISIVMLFPCSSLACRSPSAESLFATADTVILGWVHSVAVPDLEFLVPGITDKQVAMLGLGSKRILGIAVTEVRKGQSATHQSIEVGHCNGRWIDAGTFVIAHHFPSGSWQVAEFPVRGSTSEP